MDIFGNTTSITDALGHQNFGYDAFGNLTVSGNGPFQPGYNSSNQMMSPATYDADGNATSDEQHTYAWDADGQPVTIDGVAITYDALGQIVEEDKSGTYSELIYSPTGFKMQVMSGGSSVAEYAPMPGGGASVWTSSGFYYRHGDWLGSSRFASTKSQTVYYDAAYAPFGQPYAETGTTDRNFTGKDQDIVSGLYDFPAREYNGNEARWASPDPAGLAAVNPADPQTWNRYAYVRNSPLGMTDPMGLCGDNTVAYGSGCLPAQPIGTTVQVNGNDPDACDQTCVGMMNIFFGTPQGVTWNPSSYELAILAQLSPGVGGGGSPTVSGTQPPQAPTQTPQQCMSSFNNSTIGKATSFFSLLDLPSNLWDWLGFGGAKAAGVGALKAETSATVTDYSITAGTATTATTGLETVVAVGSKALGVAGSVAVVAGTAVDAQQRLVCHGLINPNDAAALGSPILPIFP